jgi:hypothetical protein
MHAPVCLKTIKVRRIYHNSQPFTPSCMLLQRCTTLPARLVPLREPFVKLLGRTRQCHMRVLLKKHCGPPADAAEDKPGPSSAPGGALGSSSDVCARGSSGPGFVASLKHPACGNTIQGEEERVHDAWDAVSQDSFVQCLPRGQCPQPPPPDPPDPPAKVWRPSDSCLVRSAAWR